MFALTTLDTNGQPLVYTTTRVPVLRSDNLIFHGLTGPSPNRTGGISTGLAGIAAMSPQAEPDGTGSSWEILE